MTVGKKWRTLQLNCALPAWLHMLRAPRRASSRFGSVVKLATAPASVVHQTRAMRPARELAGSSRSLVGTEHVKFWRSTAAWQAHCRAQPPSDQAVVARAYSIGEHRTLGARKWKGYAQLRYEAQNHGLQHLSAHQIHPRIFFQSTDTHNNTFTALLQDLVQDEGP